MAKRVTVMIDDDLVAKLRKIQADKIKNSDKAISFSSVINELLYEAMKKSN